METTKYYRIHVFYSRRNGFNIPFYCSSKDQDEETIINEAVKAGKLDETDADQVDTVDEITKEDYFIMGGSAIRYKMKASEFFYHQYTDENNEGLEMSKESAAKIGKDFYRILKPIFDACIVLPQRLCIGFEGGKGDGDVNVSDVELLPE